MNVDVEDIEVELSNVEALSDSWATQASKDIRPLTESMALILGHAIFEQAVKDLSEVVVDKMPNSLIESKYGSKSIKVEEAVADLYGTLRKVAKHEIQRNMTLRSRIALITEVCSNANAQVCRAILAVYKIDLADIESIDGRRQDVMHRIVLNVEYRFDDDRELLELAARACFHLVANCLFGEQIGVLQVQGFANGNLALTSGQEKNLIHSSQIFAVLPSTS